MSDPHDAMSDRKADRNSAVSLLDLDRTASMADEGGVSGALMEIDDDGERRHLIKRQRRRPVYGTWRTAAAGFVVVGCAVLAWAWMKRNA